MKPTFPWNGQPLGGFVATLNPRPRLPEMSVMVPWSGCGNTTCAPGCQLPGPSVAASHEVNTHDSAECSALAYGMTCPGNDTPGFSDLTPGSAAKFDSA